MQERGAVATLRRSSARRAVASAAVAAAVVAADQATTSWALADVRRPDHLLGPLGLAVQYNSGSAFSLLTGAGSWLGVVSVVVLVVLGWLTWKARSTLTAVAFGLVLGGAVGNLVDRLVRSHHGDVVDFITLSHWPTFNVADACISVGVVLLAVGYLRSPQPTAPRTGAQAAVGAGTGTAATEPTDAGGAGGVPVSPPAGPPAAGSARAGRVEAP